MRNLKSVLIAGVLSFAFSGIGYAAPNEKVWEYKQFNRFLKTRPKATKMLGFKSEPPTDDNLLQFFGLQNIRYNNVVKSASLPRLPWPDDYWATRYGGVALRWQIENESEDYRDYIYKSPSIEELKRMSSTELSLLSPAEKYDIFVGRTNLNADGSVTQMERDKVAEAAEIADGDNIPKWTGICNGWALAAREQQPMNPITVKTPWGTPMEFYATDLKALLSLAYDDFQENIYVTRLGSACDEDEGEVEMLNGRPKTVRCRDIHPASLHIALSEYVGRMKKPFVVEVDKTSEIWNHPIYGYRFNFGGPQTDARTGKSILAVTAEMDYVDEGNPFKDGFTDDEIREYAFQTMNMSYTLELDGNGLIIGGDWDIGSDHPDFIWNTEETPNARNLGPGYPIDMTTLRGLLAKSY